MNTNQVGLHFSHNRNIFDNTFNPDRKLYVELLYNDKINAY